VSSSHGADLELARRCAAGDEQAWQRFMTEYRPLLYRAADALEPGGGARDLADALYADLYGLPQGDRDRRSLFAYFHGRSSLATWLRAVLAQRYIDRLRAARRLQPLPDDEEAVPLREARGEAPADPNRAQYVTLLREAMRAAIARLADRDRLRLACYYAQEMTLAEIGRVLKEHEATVSRQLARTRQAVRGAVERQLREAARLGDAQIAACFESVSDDPGPLDVRELFAGPRKPSAPERSL